MANTENGKNRERSEGLPSWEEGYRQLESLVADMIGDIRNYQDQLKDSVNAQREAIMKLADMTGRCKELEKECNALSEMLGRVKT